MLPETLDKYIKMISSKDLSDLRYCLNALLNACNLIYNEPIRLRVHLNERDHDSALMIQKAILHGFSIEKLLEGVCVKYPNIENEVCIYEPLSLVVICRSLLESFLTFNHINVTPNDLEKEIRFKIWTIYGLRNRTKIEKNLNDQEKEKFSETLIKDNNDINELTSEIEQSQLFNNLAKEKKAALLKTIKTEWKIKFNETTFKPLGWQDLLENAGMKRSLRNEAYNFLSWYSHTTSICIYQLRDIHKDGFINLLLANALRYSSFFLSMSIADLIRLHECYQKSYQEIDQELKDWINLYNYFVRGNEYTIDKIE
jgi:hypothetical protein